MSHAQMTAEAKKSEAVQSLRLEQAAQKRRQRAASRDEECGPDDELCEGLQDTFPASDPVSPTVTTISGKPKKDAKSSRVRKPS